MYDIRVSKLFYIVTIQQGVFCFYKDQTIIGNTFQFLALILSTVVYLKRFFYSVTTRLALNDFE